MKRAYLLLLTSIIIGAVCYYSAYIPFHPVAFDNGYKEIKNRQTILHSLR